jgi:type III pantothenate kinase
VKKLLIDAGNSRIKWAQVQHDRMQQSGSMALNQISQLARQIADLKEIRQIWVSNVAGDEVAAQIRALGVPDTRFVRAQRSGYGIKNSYANPTQLGSDRWAALIAAWNIMGRECIVVNSGTATTIDTLSAQGEFTGGIILPGIELMQRNLISATADLHAGGGAYERLPINTQDGMFSGAIQATCGAIERQKRMLSDNAAFILGGGAAQILQPHLSEPLLVVEDIVLRGINLMAREETTK